MSCLGVGLDNGYDDGAGQELARTVPLFHLATTAGGLVGGFFCHRPLYACIVCDKRENDRNCRKKAFNVFDQNSM